MDSNYQSVMLISEPDDNIQISPNSKHLQTKNQAWIKIDICFRKVENIVGKGENAGKQHFLPFLQCFFKNAFSSRSLTLIFVW